MSTKAVIRAWYSIGSQYIFWGTTQITDPLSEYPSGGGYPATSLLSDFALLDYEGEFSEPLGSLLNITWDTNVSDGYAVYIDGITEEATLGDASSYSTSRIVGIAFSSTNKVITGGEYDAFCEGSADAGDPVYLSTTEGVITTTSPNTSTETLIRVGTTIESKITEDIVVVKISIDPNEPIELEEAIT